MARCSFTGVARAIRALIESEDGSETAATDDIFGITALYVLIFMVILFVLAFIVAFIQLRRVGTALQDAAQVYTTQFLGSNTNVNNAYTEANTVFHDELPNNNVITCGNLSYPSFSTPSGLSETTVTFSATCNVNLTFFGGPLVLQHTINPSVTETISPYQGIG